LNAVFRLPVLLPRIAQRYWPLVLTALWSCSPPSSFFFNSCHPFRSTKDVLRNQREFFFSCWRPWLRCLQL